MCWALAKNERLKAEIAGEMEQAAAAFAQTGKAARVFQEFAYQTRDSWSRARRVVAKAEHLEKGANPRFVVTSLSAEAWEARRLYEELYCARGEMENRIKEQLMLFADRTSTAWMRSNQIRLYFSSIAYLLLEALRRLGLKGTEWAQAQATTIRLKVLKIGALIRVTVRKVWIALAGGYPYQEVWASIWARLAAGARAGCKGATSIRPWLRKDMHRRKCAESASASALFSGGGGAENGAMVTSRSSTGAFSTPPASQGTAVEIRQCPRSPSQKTGEKSGLV